MQVIPIALSAPDMVIARDVCDGGRVLCGKGIKLTDSLIRRLRQLGVESIAVEGHPVKIEGEKSVDELLQALDRRFRRVGDNPLMAQIRDMYRERIRQTMGEDDGR
jgi:hypothetical protein